MLLYEVNIQVDADAAEEMAVWMKAHIREMLGFDGFASATWYFHDPDADGRQQWSIHYHVAGWKHLNDYFERHAAAMRQEGVDHFGGRFSANRRVLYEREQFNR